MKTTDLVSEYKIGDQSYESDLDSDLRIDKFNLSEEFEKHAGRFAWYSACYELAVDFEARLKTELERAYAKIDAQVRAQLESHNIKATEKKIEGMVLTNNVYVQLVDQYNEAKLQTGLLKAARDAMMMKKDCLISLGANVRAELSSNPSLLQTAYLESKKERQ